MKKAIVLCFDRSYCEQAIVTIKSLCAYHRNLKIYIFNNGSIPQEWFGALQNWLTPFDSRVCNIRLSEEEQELRQFNVNNSKHISATKFLIYYMADFVKEDVALYLDCNLLVTGKVDHLLEYDLDGCYVAAVNDSDLDPSKHNDIKKELNAGVLVVNLKRWREENIREKLIELTREHYMHVPNGDQSIMIMAFGEEWLPLKDTYNFLVGYDAYEISEFKKERTTIKENRMPRILHYLGYNKPWNEESFSTRFKKLWWFYYGLDWSTLYNQRQFQLELASFNQRHFTHHILVFTNTCHLSNFSNLLEEFPDCQFHIFQPCFPAIQQQYIEYPNLYYYPNAHTKNSYKHILEKALAVLDIAEGATWEEATQEALKKNVTIFAFSDTNHVGEKAIVCENTTEMITNIRKLIQEKVYLNLL